MKRNNNQKFLKQLAYMWWRNLLNILLCVVFGSSFTMAQEVGVSLCACQPSSWTFRINLQQPSSFCPLASDLLFSGPGIADQHCLPPTPNDNDPDQDLAFASIHLIQILEWDQNLDARAHQVYARPFVHGDTLTYTSMIATYPLEVFERNPILVPSSLVVLLHGSNALGQDLLDASWSVQFTNDCSVFPVVPSPRDAQGNSTPTGTLVTQLMDVSDPPQALCPLAPPPPPTLSPSMSPSTTSPSLSRSTESPTLLDYQGGGGGEGGDDPDKNTTEPPFCACQPWSWTFEVDLSLSDCPAEPITNRSNAILQQECLPPLEPLSSGNHSNSTVMTVLTSIHILELNFELEVLTQHFEPGLFQTGDTFTYTSSLLSNNESIVWNPPNIPNAFMMIMGGRNAAGEQLQASWSVQFVSSPDGCDVFPWVKNGPEDDVWLYTRLIRTKGPLQSPLCPLAPLSLPPTIEPTISPSDILATTSAPSYDANPQDNVCACQPSHWTLTLVLDSPCPTPPNKAFGVNNTGIQQESCVLGTTQGNVTDFVFHTITSVTLVELAADRSSIGQSFVLGRPILPNGTVIDYESALADPTKSYNASTVPQTLIVVLVGTNAKGQQLQNSWSVEFNNRNCNQYPVVKGGERTVGTVVTKAEGPPHVYCPAAPMAPTVSPSSRPSSSPSAHPSARPSAVPSASPATSPSVRPSWHPSIHPSQTPSGSPTFSPLPTSSCAPTTKTSKSSKSSKSGKKSHSRSKGKGKGKGGRPWWYWRDLVQDKEEEFRTTSNSKRKRSLDDLLPEKEQRRVYYRKRWKKKQKNPKHSKKSGKKTKATPAPSTLEPSLPPSSFPHRQCEEFYDDNNNRDPDRPRHKTGTRSWSKRR